MSTTYRSMNLPALPLLLVALAFAPSSAHADGIDDLVAQVSLANIQAHVATLAAAPRDSIASQKAAADYIANELTSYGYTVTRTPVATSENVIAEITGTLNPDRVFIVGAHFDSVVGGPGADDNASGVAGLLEVARVLAGSSFQSSIEFVAYGLEEVGLVGSTAHAAATATAGRDVAGMISLEMIGYTCFTPGCALIFPDLLPCFDVQTPAVSTVGDWIGVVASTDHVGLGQRFADTTARYVPSLLVGWATVSGNGACFPDTRRSDHAPFWDLGYPALLVTDTANFRNPNYHQPTDVIATLDFTFARAVTQATLATAVRTARTGCAATPLAGCRQSTVPTKSVLTLKDATPDTKDSAAFKWQAGEETAASDYGDPVAGDDYALCIYDAANQLAFAGSAPAGGTCGPKPCWKGLGNPAGAKGFKYSDKEATPDGIGTVLLKPGAEGKAKALVKGKGDDLRMPSENGLPLPLALPATVQLQAAHGECFQTRYFLAGVKKNDTNQFKAKGGSPSGAFLD